MHKLKTFFSSGSSTEGDLACDIHQMDDRISYFKMINTSICMEP